MEAVSEAKQAIAKAVDQRDAYRNSYFMGMATSLLVTALLVTWAWRANSGWAAAGAVVLVLLLTTVKLVAYATYRVGLDDSFRRMKEIAESLECSDSRQTEFLRVFRPPQEAIDEELTRIAAMMRMYLTEQAALYAQGVMPRLGAMNESETLEEMKARFERKLFDAKSLFDREHACFDKLRRAVRTMDYAVRSSWRDYVPPEVPSTEKTS